MEKPEGTITLDKIKDAKDVRKVFADVVTMVQDQSKTTADLAEQIPVMRADLETALAAQKALTEAGRPQPTGFGHVKVPSMMNTPRKMVNWATRLDAARYDGQAGQSIKHFQDCADVAAIQHNVAKHIVAKGGEEEREWYEEKIFNGEVQQQYREAAENLFAKNINTENAGEGLEWTPLEIKSSQFIDRIRDASFYAGLYVQITMANGTFTIPANGGDIGVFLVPQLTGGLPASPTTGEDTMGSREVQFIASKMGVRTGWSRESTEDMTIQSGSIITQNMAQRMADQIDSNILFGDTDGSFHTLTPAGNLAGGAARMWEGIVKECGTTAGRNADGGGATLGWQLMGDQLGRMGQAAGSRFSKTNTGANGAVYHVTWKSFFDLVKEVNGVNEFPSPIVTIDKYGPAATIIDGEAARIFGRPIIPTEFMRDDLLAASGAWATTGATAACVCSNVGQWGLGTRRGMELRVSTELYMESDAIVAVTFYRGDFQPLQVLSASGVGDLLFNIV